jgi:hypothetical protein
MRDIPSQAFSVCSPAVSEQFPYCHLSVHKSQVQEVTQRAYRFIHTGSPPLKCAFHFSVVSPYCMLSLHIVFF